MAGCGPPWKNVDREPNYAAILAVEKIFTTLANLSADVPIQSILLQRHNSSLMCTGRNWKPKSEANPMYIPPSDHLSKYRSLLPSLAGLFELADLADEGGD